jgi:outer membrane biosynthesis protein TonB
MTIRKKAIVSIVAVPMLIASVFGAPFAAHAEETPTAETAIVQSTDTNATPQPEEDVVADATENTDTVGTSSSTEEAPIQVTEPEPVVVPTPVALTEPAPAPAEAAPVQTQQVAAPSPSPTQGSGTGLPVGRAHLDIYNGVVDFQVEQIYVKFEYVINPAVTPPTPLQVAITDGSEDVAVQNRTVYTNGVFEYTFKPIAGARFYCLDIRTRVEGSDQLQTYNDRKYCGDVKERVVAEKPRETDNNSVIIPSGDPRVVYFDVNTGQVLTGEVRYDTPGANINARNADPEGNYSVEGGPWTYVYKPIVSPSPTPTPTSTPKPTVTPTPGPTATATPTPKPTASPSPTATPKPTPTSTPKPTVSPTPQPSATPTATPTQEPTVSPTPQPDPSDTASPIPTGGQPGSGAGNSDKGSSIKYYPGYSGKNQDDNKKTLAVTGQEDPTRPALVVSALGALALGLALVVTNIRRRRNSTS